MLVVEIGEEIVDFVGEGGDCEIGIVDGEIVFVDGVEWFFSLVGGCGLD